MASSQSFNFLDHLEELRTRIIVCLIALGVCSVVGYIISNACIEYLIQPLRGMGHTLYFFSPYEAFWVKLKVSILSGFVLSSPVIFWQAWLFVTPGLYARERRFIVPGVGAATILFLCGIAFCYFLVLPIALSFLLSFKSESLQPLISVKEYLALCTSFLLSFGFIFNLPLVAAGLTQVRIVHHSMLRKKRKYALVIIFIVAAILTPPDIFTQLFLALPLLVLYEVCIIVSWFLWHK